MFPFPQSVPSNAVEGLTGQLSSVLSELKGLTENFTKPFDEMSPVRQRTVIIGIAKLHSYFGALQQLGVPGVAVAIAKLEGVGVESYINVLSEKWQKEAQNDPELKAIKEAVAKSRKEWQEPKADLEAPANEDDEEYAAEQHRAADCATG